MNIAIYGTGGAGKEAYEVLVENESVRRRWDEIIFIDDTKPAGEFWECKMFPFDMFIQEYGIDDVKVLIAVGEPKLRKLLADRVREKGYQLATIFHPTAHISAHAKIGEGVFIQDYVSVSAEAVVDDNVFISGRSFIGHDVHVGANCQICSHVAIGGNTQIGENVFIGLGALLRDHIIIGKDSIISMGAVVVKDVDDERVVMGNPAREISNNSEGRVFK